MEQAWVECSVCGCEILGDPRRSPYTCRDCAVGQCECLFCGHTAVELDFTGACFRCSEVDDNPDQLPPRRQLPPAYIHDIAEPPCSPDAKIAVCLTIGAIILILILAIA